MPVFMAGWKIQSWQSSMLALVMDCFSRLIVAFNSGFDGWAMFMPANGACTVYFRSQDFLRVFSFLIRCLFKVWRPSSTISMYRVCAFGICTVILLKESAKQ